jgi:hypothetical protein
MIAPALKILTLRHLSDLYLEGFEILRFLFENDIRCAEGGKMVPEHSGMLPANLADKCQELM